MSTSTHPSDHDRHADLARAIQICRLTAREPLSLYDLAERLGCHQLTIRRAIYALRSAGVDIAHVAADAEELEAVGRPNAKLYKLDRRAWAGLLHLPADGAMAQGGAR